MNVSGKDSVKVTGFTSKYPPNFTGTVGLDASKVYSATGTNGRVSFSYNGGADEAPAKAPAAPAKVNTDNLDAVVQKRSGLKASTGKVEKPLGSKATLGRGRQK